MRTKLVITFIKDENLDPVTVYIAFESFLPLGILFFEYVKEDGTKVYLNRRVVFSVELSLEEE